MNLVYSHSPSVKLFFQFTFYDVENTYFLSALAELVFSIFIAFYAFILCCQSFERRSFQAVTYFVTSRMQNFCHVFLLLISRLAWPVPPSLAETTYPSQKTWVFRIFYQPTAYVLQRKLLFLTTFILRCNSYMLWQPSEVLPPRFLSRYSAI